MCMKEANQAMNANRIYPAAMTPLMRPWLLPHALNLPTPIYKMIAKSSLTVDPNARSSMWDDLSAGRTTEIDYLNGEILRLGKLASISCPVNQKIYDLVKEGEQNKASPKLSPDQLYESVTQS